MLAGSRRQEEGRTVTACDQLVDVGRAASRSTEIGTRLARRSALRGIAGVGLAAIFATRWESAAAQDATPPPTGAVGVSMQAMGSGQPASAPGLELTLRRTTLAVGGRLPAHSHPGALV